MATEPLIPLAQAVAAEVDRLELPVYVSVDQVNGAVLVVGQVLNESGPRRLLEASLTRARLRHEVHISGGLVVVYPSDVDAA